MTAMTMMQKAMTRKQKAMTEIRKTLAKAAASIAAVALAGTVVTSCDKAEERFSNRPCYFLFRADYHPASILARVLNNPGMFVNVKTQSRQGIRYIMVSAPFDISADDKNMALTTDIENRYSYTLGANNSLIIGCSVTNEWRAYDGQCPYCLDNHSTTNFPLSWTENGNGHTVTCNNCKRTYNLNYGTSDDGHRLVEYRIRFDGNVLMVSN